MTKVHLFLPLKIQILKIKTKICQRRNRIHLKTRSFKSSLTKRQGKIVVRKLLKVYSEAVTSNVLPRSTKVKTVEHTEGVRRKDILVGGQTVRPHFVQVLQQQHCGNGRLAGTGFINHHTDYY
jgi:hypothetical protein